jgi:DmsE family decaheme c-type cytochrome
MKMLKGLMAILALCAGSAALAADNAAPAATWTSKPALSVADSKAKDAVCTRCHDESEAVPVLAIAQTRHGVKADTRTPNCQSCHGESAAHLKGDPTQQTRPRPDVVFGKKTYKPNPAGEMNGACLACHENGKRMLWAGSTHENRDVACVSCHQIHAVHDKVRDKLTQPDVCFACHKEQRGQINKPSHHPIPEGKMACADCHNAHGSAGPKLMKRDSVNDTCYSCHMEKRGPFVHNHEPVSDDCTNCHNPHGTTAENLLKARPPFLCHQCHVPHGTGIAQLGGQGQTINPTGAGQSGINVTQGRGCVNCHNQIHGSNNANLGTPTPQFFYR